MSSPWLAERQQIAHRAAADLAAAYPDGEVWLVGALAEQLAHTHSDIDLLVVVPAEPPPALRSRLVSGIRVDVRALTARTVGTWRQLLADFAVARAEVETFRTVRALLPDLTLLRTARQLVGTGTRTVLEPGLRDGYRRWAVADRCESAASLAEDLVGLAEAGLHRHADRVWGRLGVVLAQAETAASGAPLLGEKWLPSLQAHHHGGAEAELPAPDWAHAAARSPWFSTVQLRLVDALLATWPLAATEPDPPAKKGLTGFGWLPQRYADGWFLRRGDVHVPLTEGELLAWRGAVARHIRP